MDDQEKDSDLDGIPLPGGGVFRQKSAEEESETVSVEFADLVRPFLLLGLTSLGVIPHPDTGRSTVDLAAARSAIETLELLSSRTDGRRTDSETKLLEQALFDLRMHFVEAEKGREHE